ncbi:MAG: hypothetical protein OXC63_14655 [Aestuariivita sp.]|nr:hypothetical protein [Aestuariivita sp.]
MTLVRFRKRRRDKGIKQNPLSLYAYPICNPISTMRLLTWNGYTSTRGKHHRSGHELTER